MNKPRVWIPVCCMVVLASCAGEPFRAVPQSDESGYEGVSPPVDHTLKPDPALGALPEPALAYARKGLSQIAALHPTSGKVLSATVVGDIVLDMVRDGDRLLVATSVDDLETSRVRAFRLGATAPSLLGESEPLGPAARLFPFPPYTLVLTEDMAVIWTLLDSELDQATASKAVARPASLLVARAKGQSQVLALSSSGFEAGQYFDTLVAARFDAGWQLEFQSIPAPHRPSSRLAGVPGCDEGYLVRKSADKTEIEIGELSLAEPAPPAKFRSVSVPAGIGSIEAAEVDTQREVLIVLLSRGASAGALALVPLREGVSAALVPLSASVESSPWFSRALALSVSGRVLAATTSGIEAFELNGTADAPALIAMPSFDGKGLAAPVVFVAE